MAEKPGSGGRCRRRLRARARSPPAGPGSRCWAPATCGSARAERTRPASTIPRTAASRGPWRRRRFGPIPPPPAFFRWRSPTQCTASRWAAITTRSTTRPATSPSPPTAAPPGPSRMARPPRVFVRRWPTWRTARCGSRRAPPARMFRPMAGETGSSSTPAITTRLVLFRARRAGREEPAGGLRRGGGSRRYSVRPGGRLTSAVRRSSCPAFPLDRLDEHFGGDAELPVQSANHVQRKSTLSTHDFMDPTAGADDADQCAGVPTLLLQAETNCLNRIRRVHGKVLILVSVYQGDQHLQAIAIRGAFLRTPETVDFLQGSAVVCWSPNRLNLHVAPSSRQSNRTRRDCRST